MSSEKVDRREYLKYIGSFIIGAVIFGGGVAAYYASLPAAKEIITKTVTTTVPGPTITQTITVTATPTPSPTPTPTPEKFPLPHWPKEILVRGGGVGGPWLLAGAPLCDLITKHLGVKASIQPGGAVINILSISKGESDIVWSYDWMAALAKDPIAAKEFYGEIVNYPRIKAIAGGLWSMYYYFAAKPDFPANTFEEIAKLVKEGKPLRIGGDIVGSSEEWMHRTLLKLYGITYDDIKKAGGTVYSAGDTPAATALRECKIDMIYQAGGIPEKIMLELDTMMELKPILLTDKERDYLEKQFGFVKGSIPKGKYRYAKEDVPTVRGTTALLARTELPDDLIYHIVRLLSENLSYIAAAYKPIEEFDVKTGWKLIGLWELHPGAAKFYKDRGYMP